MLYSICQLIWKTQQCGHRTEKIQFLFQSQRRALPKNVPTTIQLCSFHMIGRLCSRSFKLGFNSNINRELPDTQVEFRKERNQRSNSSPSLNHRESKGIPENICCFIDYAKLFVYITTNWKIVRHGNTRLTYLSPKKPVCGSRSNC